MAREVAWIRKIKKGRLTADVYHTDAEKYVIVDAMEHLGLEKVSGTPFYDNGDFIVIDTVKDLTFAVARVHAGGLIQVMREVNLDKYEAIRIADEFKEVLNEGQGPDLGA